MAGKGGATTWRSLWSQPRIPHNPEGIAWSLDVLRPRRSRTNGAQHTSPGQARLAGAALGSKPKAAGAPSGALEIVHSGGGQGRRHAIIDTPHTARFLQGNGGTLNSTTEQTGSWPPNVASAPIGRTAMGRLTQGGAREAGLPWAGMLRTLGAGGSSNVQTPNNPEGIASLSPGSAPLRECSLVQRPGIVGKAERGLPHSTTLTRPRTRHDLTLSTGAFPRCTRLRSGREGSCAKVLARLNRSGEPGKPAWAGNPSLDPQR
jgi:hypothetical protein